MATHAEGRSSLKKDKSRQVDFEQDTSCLHFICLCSSCQSQYLVFFCVFFCNSCIVYSLSAPIHKGSPGSPSNVRLCQLVHLEPSQRSFWTLEGGQGRVCGSSFNLFVYCISPSWKGLSGWDVELMLMMCWSSHTAVIVPLQVLSSSHLNCPSGLCEHWQTMFEWHLLTLFFRANNMVLHILYS